MIEIINLSNIFCCFTVGLALLLIQTTPQLKDRHYRSAKIFLGVASIIVALGTAAILINGVSAEEVEILSAPILIVSQLQAALFTFLVLTLFHSPYVKRRNIIAHLLPTFVFVALYLPTVFLWGEIDAHTIEEHIAHKAHPALVLRTLYGFTYLAQITFYIGLFRRERTLYIARIDNFFSDTDTDTYNLNWATRLFYQATAIGLVVFVLCLFPNETFDAVLTIAITYLYFSFSVQYINYQYRMHYALRAVENRCDNIEAEPDTKYITPPDEAFKQTIETLTLYLRQGVVLADYSDVLKISERKLSFYFNSTYGMSFKRWINTRRIDHAKQLIGNNPSLMIDDIADRSGFANKAHFSRTFKEITGSSYIDHKNS